MAEGEALEEILSDRNFKKLSSYNVAEEEFVKLIDAHVSGYTQKKRLADALKDLSGRVDAIQERLSIAKAVGKAKGKLEPEEQALADNYDNIQLKDKVKALNAKIQATIDECQLTASEKDRAVKDFHLRQQAAKAADKAKLTEKLEGMIKSVTKGKPIVQDVANVDKLFDFHKELKLVAQLEKRPPKSLIDSEKEMLKNKAKTQLAMKDLVEKSRMWFESAEEFKPRLDQAMADQAIKRAAQIKLEEEQAAEQRRLDAEMEIEAKKQREIEKQELAYKELADKLEAKRLEAAAKPQKPVAPKVVKEKKKVAKMDAASMFMDPREERAAIIAEEAAAAVIAEAEAAKASPAPSSSAAPSSVAHTPLPSPQLKASQAPVPQAQPKTAAELRAEARLEADKKKKLEAKPKTVLENKWGTDGELLEQAEGDEEEPDDGFGPSLSSAAAVADAKVAPAKKAPQAPPAKKKEKKKFSKIGIDALGFEGDKGLGR